MGYPRHSIVKHRNDILDVGVAFQSSLKPRESGFCMLDGEKVPPWFTQGPLNGVKANATSNFQIHGFRRGWKTGFISWNGHMARAKGTYLHSQRRTSEYGLQLLEAPDQLIDVVHFYRTTDHDSAPLV